MITFLVFLILSVAVGSLLVIGFERHQDVLHGPYVRRDEPR